MADHLTKQLEHLPGIVQNLGLAIAQAQAAMNADYVRTLDQLLGMIQQVSPTLAAAPAAAPAGDAAAADALSKAESVRELIRALAPSRYQFTETTLDFSADIAQHMDVTGTAGVGFGTPALTVNAALTLGFGYDYRAAARITTQLHAIPTTPQMAESLLARAGEVHKTKRELPERSVAEDALWKSTASVYEAISGSKAKKLEELPEPPA